MNLFCIEFHLAKVSLVFFFYLDLNLTMHTQSNNTQFMENINETETLEMEADTCKKILVFLLLCGVMEELPCWMT